MLVQSIIQARMQQRRKRSIRSNNKRNRINKNKRSRRSMRGGDCGCGNSQLQHLMNRPVVPMGQGVSAGSFGQGSALDANRIITGGAGWAGGPNPFFPDSDKYPSYPLNDHNNDPNNPSMIINAGQPQAMSQAMRGGRKSRHRLSRSRRLGRTRRLGRRQRGGTWLNDLFFGQSNNMVYQMGTTPGAELQRAVFLQKGTDSAPFSQMGPSNHNRLYV